MVYKTTGAPDVSITFRVNGKPVTTLRLPRDAAEDAFTRLAVWLRIDHADQYDLNFKTKE